MGRLTGSEIADIAVRSYQALAWTFLRRTVVPTLFCVAAWLFVVHFSSDIFELHRTDKSGQVTELLVKMALSLGAALPVFLIGISWVTAIITALASDWMLDRVPDGAAASRRAIMALPRLAAATIREALIALGGSLIGFVLLFFSSLIPENSGQEYVNAIVILGTLGVIVGCLIAIYVVVIHSLTPAIVMVEGLKAGKAAKRSRMLVSAADQRRQNPGQAALVLLGGVTILSIFATLAAISSFNSIVDVPAHIKTWMPGTVFNVVLTYVWELVPVFIVLWIVLPIWCLGTVAVYYTTRVRFEGYDIDLLASEVWQRDKRARFEV